MNQAAVIVLRRHEDRRLTQHGHSVKWRKSGSVWRGTCLSCGGQLECDRYGTHWLASPGHPSLLRWPGVNYVARCPGGAR